MVGFINGGGNFFWNADLIPIKKLLEQTLKSVKLEPAAALAAVTSHWEEIVGEQLARVASPVLLSGKTLIVDVNDPAFLEPLEYQKGKILSRTRKHTEKEAVNRIKFRYMQKGHR